MYGLLSLLVCLHWWSAYRIMQKDGRASNHEWGVFLFSAALAFYTHNLAGFSIIAPSVFLILQRRWKLAARLIAVQAAALLLYLPWLIFLPGQIHKIQSAFWTPRPGILEIVQTVIMFSANLPLPGSNLIWGLAFSLLVFSTVLWWLLKKRKQIKLIAYPLVLLLTAPTLLFVISQFMRPVYVQRAFLPASFGYLILIGSCLAESFGQKSSRIPRAAAIGLLLAGLLSARLGFITFITYDQFPRSPFQSLANVLRSRSSELDCILHDNKLSYFPTHFYAPELAQSFLADSPGSINDTFAPASQAAMQIFPVPDVQAASADCNHIAFIVFDKSLIELGGETYHPVWQYLSQHFRGGNKMAVGDIWIYFFERNRP